MAVADLNVNLTLAEATQMTGIDQQIGVKFVVKPGQEMTIADGKKAYIQLNFKQVVDTVETEVVIAKEITGASGDTTITVADGYTFDEYYYPGTLLTAANLTTVFPTSDLSAKIYIPA